MGLFESGNVLGNKSQTTNETLAAESERTLSAGNTDLEVSFTNLIVAGSIPIHLP